MHGLRVGEKQFRRTDTLARLANALLVHGRIPPTNRQLAEMAEMSLRTVSQNTSDLRALKVLVRDDKGFAFGPATGLVAVGCVGGETVRAALVDANGNLYHEKLLGPQGLGKVGS